jgi:hypothetical protein
LNLVCATATISKVSLSLGRVCAAAKATASASTATKRRERMLLFVCCGGEAQQTIALLK